MAQNSFMKKLGMQNPFIMAPLKLGYSDGKGNVTQKHIDFYVRRAKYLGAIIPEPLYIHSGLRELPTQLGIDSDDKIDGLKGLVDKIHEQGAKVIAHLNHPGRMANPKIPNNFFVSSTDKPCENGGATPKRMDANDIKEAIDLVVEAAKRAEKAGFDAVELQFGHGYLVAQFLSPAVNDRDDEYNGDLKARARFGLEMLRAVKSAINIPIMIRLSGDELIPNGFHVEEMIEFSKMLENEGVDALHITGGTVCSTPHWFFQHMVIAKGKLWEFAQKIAKEVSIPVTYVGRINEFEDIDYLKNDVGAELIGVGRALVADPDFIGKYLGEIKEPYRPCMACSEGCLGGVKGGRGLHCVANPLAGEHEMETITPAPEKKKYIVVGAGPAGMEAAITLKKRGHDVTVYEKEKLGGQFNLAYLPPKKSSLKKLIEYYEKMAEFLDIPIVKKEFTPADLEGKDIDGVIIATGAQPAIPPIKGLKEYSWAEVLEEDNLPEGKNVVVIGGGLIGLEVAEALVAKNNKVTIIEMLDEVGRGMEMLEKKYILNQIKSANVQTLINTKVTAVEGSTILLDGGTINKIENVDHIVLATGMKSYHPLADELRDKVPTYLVGDAKQVGKVMDAIADAYLTAKNL